MILYDSKRVILRQGCRADAGALKAIDTVAVNDSDRAADIDRWLAQGDLVLIAEFDGCAIGYGVLSNSFFKHAIVELLMVHRQERGQGIGRKLLRALEERCNRPKLFASTNKSNAIMQDLLISSGYRECGYIDELDPGDPELVFIKILQRCPSA